LVTAIDVLRTVADISLISVVEETEPAEESNGSITTAIVPADSHDTETLT
jgi:hypothetical protein